MIIIGIDTSCDDTSVALLEDGRRVLSSIVSSQVELHRLFGGVVPEIASRKHAELIDGIYGDALRQAGMAPHDIDAIAVTAGPGLIGSVLVGLSFAKGLSLSLNRPIVAVNHVEAHAMSILLERQVLFPYVALVVSGGHTIILRMDDPFRYQVLGSTRDDAAGEALDKIAKYLGIGYPGGRVIEELSGKGRCDEILFPRPMMDENNYDFSFSGLKTSVINYVKKYSVNGYNLYDMLASFQEAVCEVLVAKTVRAAMDHGIARIVVGGGVASNGRLRQVFHDHAGAEGLEVFFSSPELCTDNGAMVALVGFYHYEARMFSSIDVKGFSRMALSKNSCGLRVPGSEFRMS
jgi:N6-L-threonylcarbamoyladenine synthase